MRIEARGQCQASLHDGGTASCVDTSRGGQTEDDNETRSADPESDRQVLDAPKPYEP